MEARGQRVSAGSPSAATPPPPLRSHPLSQVAGIRAALVWNQSTAELARQHNDANVCAIGARQHEADEVLSLIDTFIATPFSGDERHARRIGQIRYFEDSQSVPETGVNY